MTFKPIRQLMVTRILSKGMSLKVGTLAQNRTGSFFQYDEDYLNSYGNLSPFILQGDAALQKAPADPHRGYSWCLCQSPDVGRLQFRRAIFNLFAANQDDHSKNWSFLQNDDGQWSAAPFYDVTYSPHPFNQHATAFGGYGNQSPVKTLERLAVAAGFSTWQEARAVVQEVAEAVSHFDEVAVRLGVSKTTIAAIGKTLKQRKDDNKILLR